MADFKPFAGLAQEFTVAALLARIVKMLEPISLKDSGGRQRIVVDNSPILGAGSAAIGSVQIDLWDRRQFQPNSRAAYNGLRQNLKFN